MMRVTGLEILDQYLDTQESTRQSRVDTDSHWCLDFCASIKWGKKSIPYSWFVHIFMLMTVKIKGEVQFTRAHHHAAWPRRKRKEKKKKVRILKPFIRKEITLFFITWYPWGLWANRTIPPRWYPLNSHKHTPSKSRAGFEHKAWGANPCLIPLHQLLGG